MELYSISFSTLGVITIIIITAIFFLIINRLLRNKIQRTTARVIVSSTISILLIILGIMSSVYLQLRD